MYINKTLVHHGQGEFIYIETNGPELATIEREHYDSYTLRYYRDGELQWSNTHPDLHDHALFVRRWGFARLPEGLERFDADWEHNNNLTGLVYDPNAKETR